VSVSAAASRTLSSLTCAFAAGRHLDNNSTRDTQRHCPRNPLCPAVCLVCCRRTPSAPLHHHLRNHISPYRERISPHNTHDKHSTCSVSRSASPARSVQPMMEHDPTPHFPSSLATALRTRRTSSACPRSSAMLGWCHNCLLTDSHVTLHMHCCCLAPNKMPACYRQSSDPRRGHHNRLTYAFLSTP